MEPLVIRQNYVAAALREFKTNMDTGRTTWLLAKLAMQVGVLVNAEASETWNVSVGWTGDRKAGMTKYHPTEPTIIFSKDFILRASIEDCLEVIYHEVAHAFAGEAAGHGDKWFEQCVRLGITGELFVARPNHPSSGMH
jgi:hypothetical protein